MVIFSLIIFARCQCVSSIQKFMFRLCTHWPNIYDPCIGISNQKNQHKYNKSNKNLLPAMRIKSRPMYTLFFFGGMGFASAVHLCIQLYKYICCYRKLQLLLFIIGIYIRLRCNYKMHRPALRGGTMAESSM